MAGKVKVEVDSGLLRVRICAYFEFKEFQHDKHASIAENPQSIVSIVQVIRFDINVELQVLQIER